MSETNDTPENPVFDPNEALTDAAVQPTTEQSADVSASTEQTPTETPQAAVEQQPAAPVEPETPAKMPNAIVNDDWSTPKVADGKFAYTFSLPSIGLGPFNKKINEIKGLELDPNAVGLKTWRKVNEEAIDYYTAGALYQNRFTDEGSRFSQGVETKEGELKTISQLKFKQTDGELNGELAVLKVSKMLGLGDVLSVPLPHSGIWVTIKPPTEKDLIDFYNSIFKEKVALGRSTFGLTLTNFSVYVNRKLFDFILKHVHSVNYQGLNKNELDNYILIHDFPILAWGFAATIYPNGFDYQRACIDDVEQCSYVAKAVLNMLKLLWVDNPSLTEAQKIIMAENRPNKLTIENYRKYISEHVRVSGTEFQLKPGIKFKLRIPTFIEYTTDGLSWINKINSAIDSFIVEEGDEAEAKTQLLDQYVRSSILCQFNHFIDYIEIDENTITDRKSINEVLEVFSADDDLRTEITNKILKFKADTTIALVGIPDYKCPNCGKPQNPDALNPRLSSVIPLDSMNLFFTLITLRISKIMEREV